MALKIAASTAKFGKRKQMANGNAELTCLVPTCRQRPQLLQRPAPRKRNSPNPTGDHRRRHTIGGPMPITAFNSFTDGLDPNQRSREHFITNINLEDDRLWVPYADGVWFQPCSFNVTSGGFSVVLKGLPGSMVGTHYHVGTVHGYTMRGHWRYLEHDWIAKPGTYIYEPAGEAHTLVITEDSPEPMMTLFVVQGGLVYLDKAVNGSFAAYEDGFTLLELTRKYYREAGLDARQLDLLVR